MNTFSEIIFHGSQKTDKITDTLWALSSFYFLVTPYSYACNAGQGGFTLKTTGSDYFSILHSTNIPQKILHISVVCKQFDFSSLVDNVSFDSK